MKKNWFYRLLLSYLPVFLVMIVAVILIVFVQLSRYSKQEALKANDAFITFLKQSLDASLTNVDELAVDFLNKAAINDFYYNPEKQNDQMLAYQISTDMHRIVLRSDFIDSMYLYRMQDDIVLSYDMLKPRTGFGDQAFIDQIRQADFLNYWWSDVRSYRSFEGLEKYEKVVSLVRKVPLLTGTHGLLVININTDSIQRFVTKVFGDNKSYYAITDRHYELIAGNASHGDEVFVNRVRLPLTSPDSAYTGWHYESGLHGGAALAASSMFSYVGWMTLLIVLLGIGWIIVLTRRNYKPLESIMKSIDAYSLSKTRHLIGGKRDEFRFIQSALDDLVQQSNGFQKQYAEGLVYEYRQRFFDLMYGMTPFGREEWEQTAAALDMRPPYKRFTIAVMEIDRYSEFETKYSREDQNLLKFVLTSMVKEMAGQYRISVWKEWMSADQLGVLFQLPATANSTEGQGAEELCESIRSWVQTHLDFSVTLGISSLAEDYEQLPVAYEAASEALKYKTTLGSNRVIRSCELEQLPKSDLFYNTRLIKSMILGMKNGEEGWRSELDLLFEEIVQARLNRDEIGSLMNYMSFQLHRELGHLPGEIWSEPYASGSLRIEKLLATYDVLDDLKQGAFAFMDDLAAHVAAHRENHSNKELIREVKAYIEQHYNDPDISLVQITDRFGIKYVSQFFKDEIGEKFSEYLARVRIEKAKTLLQETEDSVQEIAARVGYSHSFSFIRMFKRMVGVTPGDYRKEQHSSK
ncbi:Helix-turn-helix domain-containing protein [Paenibacillus sp. UNCCL117]|uniref:helix-turn-helix domain-containing protein n=1 Tax=unclassified Paenibacillus TaxID=185978 RepID=UPI00088F5B85|nr:MULTISPECIES: helix-turn-helix domain-containing protein [unclassified Paenibacillus]SDE46323.1 Helix-turn-helix domain-containing protein [Paenibacillus sp. cl123]SFW65877.1 Helix-turn-helix domain-containing protein [Paenibacillus sp. UNCCL117]